MTIDPADLTVTAEPKTVAYREAPPVYSSKISGLVADDTEEALEGEITYLCDYAVGKDVGEYEILPSGLTAKNGNYTIAYIPGTLNVTQSAPELSIENLSALDRVYDAAALEPKVRSNSDGALTVTFMKGNEVIPNAPAAAGSYRVIVNTEATKNWLAGNKEFSFEIRKVPLTVTAKDLRIPVSSEIPEYEAVYEGFAGADNAASLGGNLQFTCSYTKESAVGAYEIMPYGLTSENYEIRFVRGTLTVERKSGGGSSSGGRSSSADTMSESGSWKRNEKGWWYEYKDSSYPMGGWSKDAEGNIIETLTWRKINGRWWAFGNDGYLKTGWVKDNVTGNWYMNDENAGMLEEWYLDPHSGSWYYLEPGTGIMLTGWHFINGRWYYLSETSGAIPLGAMYRSAWTPDGYLVDETGAWKEDAGRKQ